MADTWPGTLPQQPLAGSYAEQQMDNVVRGPAAPGAEGQRRRRFSSATKTVSFSMNMTAAQLATLNTFYNTTLGGGAFSFLFTDPVVAASKEFSFTEPYQVQHTAKDEYRVTMTLVRKAE